MADPNPTLICVINTPTMAVLASQIGKGEPYRFLRMSLGRRKDVPAHMQDFRYFPRPDIIILCVGERDRKMGNLAARRLKESLADLGAARPFVVLFAEAGRGCSTYASSANVFLSLRVGEDQLSSVANKVWTETTYKYGNNRLRKQKIPVAFGLTAKKVMGQVTRGDFPDFLDRLKRHGSESRVRAQAKCSSPVSEAAAAPEKEPVAAD